MTLILLLGSVFSQNRTDGSFTLGEIAFIVTDLHFDANAVRRERYIYDPYKVSIDIGKLKLGLSEIEATGEVINEREQGQSTFKFNGPNFELSNIKIKYSTLAPYLWERILRQNRNDESSSYIETQAKNDIIFTLGKVQLLLESEGNFNVNGRNQLIDFNLKRSRFGVSNVGVIIEYNDDKSKTTELNLSDFKIEIENLILDLNSESSFPRVDNAIADFKLINLEIKFPKEIKNDPEFKELASFLGIRGGQFRVREVEVKAELENGRKMLLNIVADTQFGKGEISSSYRLDFNEYGRLEDIFIEKSIIELSDFSRGVSDLIINWEKNSGQILPRKGKSIVCELSGSLKDPIIREPSKRSK
jgi:hypothetical protein